jgi:hypothetical protein
VHETVACVTAAQSAAVTHPVQVCVAMSQVIAALESPTRQSALDVHPGTQLPAEHHVPAPHAPWQLVSASTPTSR